jgi:hypothetical protein
MIYDLKHSWQQYTTKSMVINFVHVGLVSDVSETVSIIRGDLAYFAPYICTIIYRGGGIAQLVY